MAGRDDGEALTHYLWSEALKSLSVATACAGGSVEYGLSATGGVDGFYEHCTAADKR